MKKNCAGCHYLKRINGIALERGDRASVVYKRSGCDPIIKQLTCHKKVWERDQPENKNFEELKERVYNYVCFHFRKHKEGVSPKAMEDIQSKKSHNNKLKISMGFNFILLSAAVIELLIILNVI